MKSYSDKLQEMKVQRFSPTMSPSRFDNNELHLANDDGSDLQFLEPNVGAGNDDRDLYEYDGDAHNEQDITGSSQPSQAALHRMSIPRLQAIPQSSNRVFDMEEIERSEDAKLLHQRHQEIRGYQASYNQQDSERDHRSSETPFGRKKRPLPDSFNVDSQTDRTVRAGVGVLAKKDPRKKKPSEVEIVIEGRAVDGRTRRHPWTPDELTALEEGLKKYGTSWAAISIEYGPADRGGNGRLEARMRVRLAVLSLFNKLYLS